MRRRGRRRGGGGWVAGWLVLFWVITGVCKYNRTLRWTIALRWPMIVTIMWGQRGANQTWFDWRFVLCTVYPVPVSVAGHQSVYYCWLCCTPYEVFVMLVTQHVGAGGKAWRHMDVGQSTLKCVYDGLYYFW